MTGQEIVCQARKANVLLVRFLYCGNDGIIRGKATHIDHLEQRLTEGFGLPSGLQSFTMLDQPMPGERFDPVSEMRLFPDFETFCVLPYAPRQARLFCNLGQQDQRLRSICPRRFLQGVLANAARHGLHIRAAFENEFYLLREIAGQYQPCDTSRIYSTRRLTQPWMSCRKIRSSPKL